MTALNHPGVMQEEKALMNEPDWEALHELYEQECKQKKESEKNAEC